MIYKLSIILLAAYVTTTWADIVYDPCTACTFDYRPVCGSNGKNYAHKCMLDCERKTNPDLTFTDGPCPKEKGCLVTLEYKPICGSDGKEYPNLSSFECERRSNPDLTYVKGFCPCKVNFDYRPICGSDGKDYPNHSSLKCAQRSNPGLSYTEGRCKEDLPQLNKDCTRIPCTRKLEPVCASNGRSYNNECMMKCEDETLTVVSLGRCSEE